MTLITLNYQNLTLPTAVVILAPLFFPCIKNIILIASAIQLQKKNFLQEKLPSLDRQAVTSTPANIKSFRRIHFEKEPLVILKQFQFSPLFSPKQTQSHKSNY